MGERARALVLAATVVAAAVVGGLAVGDRAAAQTAGDTLVVDKADASAYDSIQHAVDNASDGDRVEVRPGTYTEPVNIRKNITLVAPDGATVANSSAPPDASLFYRHGIQVFGQTTPTVEGFTIDGWRTGFSAGASKGAWTLRDTTITDSSLSIGAAGTPAAWTVENVTVTNARGSSDLSAFESSGDWVVRESTFRGGGIFAGKSTGDWTVERTTFRNDPDRVINAEQSNGDWTVQSVTIANASDGIAAEESGGNWTVRNTVVRNATNDGVTALDATGDWTIESTTVTHVSDDAVEAVGARGDWAVENATLTDTRDDAVDAFNATGNWTVRNTVVRNATDSGVAAVETSGDWTVENTTVTDVGDDAVDAFNTTGEWVVRESVVEGSLVADDAAVEGNATRNYWGATDGPSGDFPGSGDAVTGNVSVEPFYTDAGRTTLGTFDATRPLVVDKSDPDVYDSIQHAVDNASDGDRVEVRPGTYAESVTLGKNVTLVAPNGATIENDSTVAGTTAIGIGDPNTPTVEGFRLDDWTYGVYNTDATGAWTLRDVEIVGIGAETGAGVVAADATSGWAAENVTITDTRLGVNALDTSGSWRLDGVRLADVDEGITAGRSTSDWVARNVTVQNASNVGIDAPRTTGDWTVENATVASPARYGINAEETEGRWTVADSTVRDVERYYAVDAVNTTSAWTVRNTTIANASDGVAADESAGDWTVRDTVVQNTTNDGVAAEETSGDWTVENTTVTDAGDDAVDAFDTTGEWVVRESVVRGADGLDASDAAVEGNATRNYWGATDGPSGDFPGSGSSVDGNVSVEPFYTDAGRTTLGTFGAGGPLVVDEDDASAYDSIQHAVDNASDGDRVEVRPGTYAEDVRVTTDGLSLVGAGAGQTTLVGQGSPAAGPSATLSVDTGVGSLSVSGLRVEAGASASALDVRAATAGPEVDFENNTFVGSDGEVTAFVGDGHEDVDFENNTFTAAPGAEPTEHLFVGGEASYGSAGASATTPDTADDVTNNTFVGTVADGGGGNAVEFEGRYGEIAGNDFTGVETDGAVVAVPGAVGSGNAAGVAAVNGETTRTAQLLAVVRDNVGVTTTAPPTVTAVGLSNPTERTLQVTVTTTGSVSGTGLAVELGNATATTGTDVTLADGEFTATERSDGRYTYTASVTADVPDGSSATYRASVASVDGRTAGVGALPTSQRLRLAAATTVNGSATVRTGSASVPEVTAALDGGVETNLTVSTADALPATPGENETALRSDLAVVDEDDTVVSALTVNVDRADADTPATLRITVDAGRVDGDPTGLVVARNGGTGYGALETTVVETTGDTVVLEARSPDGFSVFAVVDTDASPATVATPASGDDRDDSDAGGGGSGSGLAGVYALGDRSVTERLAGGAITEVTAEFGRETTGAVRIRASDSLPAGVPAPDDTVVAAFEVVPPADVADRAGRVRVTLDRAAVDDAGAVPAQLRVVRADDGRLESLPTRVVRVDDRTVVLSAETTGFSSFAVVVGETATTRTATTERTPTATATQPTTERTPTATATQPTTERTPAATPTSSSGGGFGVVVALVAALAAALLVRRRA